jgi:PAS domain S-box-containing protein
MIPTPDRADTNASGSYSIEERFFDLSIDMLCVLGFDGYFRRLNAAWERTLGFTIDELKARPFFEFVHPDDRGRTLNQNGAVRGGSQALSFENRYLCKDGSFRWFRWNARPDSTQQVIFSVARDVTAEKESAAERERLVSQLQSALAEIKVLQEILPVCSYCRKIRSDNDYWVTVESYIAEHTNSTFTHGVCPDCMRQHVEPELERWEGV